MKFAPVGIAALVATLAALGGCQAKMTLEEAQAQCEKQGGLLAVIYTQQISASGLGQRIAHPGDCISPSKFGASNAPPPAN